MSENFDMKCENCAYCEYTIYNMVCRYNGEICPTDGSCYKENQSQESEEKE